MGQPQRQPLMRRDNQKLFLELLLEEQQWFELLGLLFQRAPLLPPQVS